jgi:hypothetical protein
VFLSRWFPDDPFFRARAGGLVDDWLAGGKWVKRTPKGLGYSGNWGTLRHVGNAVFLMLAYAKGAGDPALERRINCFAHAQARHPPCINWSGHARPQGAQLPMARPPGALWGGSSCRAAAAAAPD